MSGLQPQDKARNEVKQRNKRLIIKLSIGVVLMFGFCYMLVPLYNLVCKQAGLNGRSATRDVEAAHLAIDKTRDITVTFTTTIHGDLPFQFKPLIRHITMHPGETKQVFFFAENDSGHNMTVQAVPSIAPGQAAKYLKKTQCFCFTQQTLVKAEKVDMPVVFHLDPELPKDITYLTLNYTLFDATKFLKNVPHFTKGRIDL